MAVDPQGRVGSAMREATAAVVDPPAARERRGTTLPDQVLVLTGRSLRAVLRDPRLILTNLLAPLLMLVVFSQIFGSVAQTPGFPAGTAYIDFLVPAILINTTLQAAVSSAFALTSDMTSGIVARLRCLPVWPGSILLARSFADLVRSAIQLLLILVLATALLGFRPPGGVTGTLAAWALALIVGTGLGWIFIAAACRIREAELMQGAATLLMFPLMFCSTAFMPLAGLPGWLRAVAEVNPMSYGIDAARALVLGQPVGAAVITAIGMSLLVGGVAGVFAVRAFRRPI
ncbi:ABC transporter permease [Actinoalloteichus hymeniacidonis]|uniref:Transport permease protein n=1 Tax=Actinoalloteichus hymeniacidonis TaxID=340345 RepID=A0AAC9HP28_9PSEU|nr:ABC transporter permease [Actinoalloteichus hymeniacidonis]AOS62361.1 ABC-type multidrug transport system, permease component [Actinoalloteichus hymeniacidonis]MBB5909611.1 ABC-2 type transport system permease protein [Actinoalloteichus hymeniacidonis]